jgi:pimeloyl-[acyl-carrier protein] methyl ester esterase
MAPPTLILLPGLQGGDLFEPFARHIPADLPTRTFAYPTHQRSTHASMLAHLESQLADTDNLILLGESYSGPLALRFACKHPTRVRAVILCASFIKPPVPRLLCYLAQPFIFARFPLPDFLLRLFIAGTNAPRPTVGDLRDAIHANRRHVLAHRVSSAAWINAARDLQKCPVPIFCLAAANDHLVGRRALRRIRRIRPSIAFAEIQGPHLILQCRPAESWRQIARFLASLATAHNESPIMTPTPALEGE